MFNNFAEMLRSVTSPWYNDIKLYSANHAAEARCPSRSCIYVGRLNFDYAISIFACIFEDYRIIVL